MKNTSIQAILLATLLLMTGCVSYTETRTNNGVTQTTSVGTGRTSRLQYGGIIRITNTSSIPVDVIDPDGHMVVLEVGASFTFTPAPATVRVAAHYWTDHNRFPSKTYNCWKSNEDLTVTLDPLDPKER